MHPRPKILITAFKPFAGRLLNGSFTLLTAVEKAGWNWDIHTLLMDVVWDAPEEELLPLIGSINPHMVIAMGEGNPRQIALETRARNIRNGVDNQDRNQQGTLIDCQSPEFRSARFEFQYSTALPIRTPVVLSRDAGAFLCNNTLYALLGTPVPKALFLHLPPQEDTPDDEYVADLLPVLNAIIRSNCNSTNTKT